MSSEPYNHVQLYCRFAYSVQYHLSVTPNIGSSATEEELRILVVGWFHCTRPALWGHHGWPAGLLSSQFPILSISKQCNQDNRCNGTLSFERLNIWTLFTVTSIWPSWPSPCCEVYWTTSLIMRHQWIRDSWFLRIYRRICMNFKWAPAILHLAPTVYATTPAGNNNIELNCKTFSSGRNQL